MSGRRADARGEVAHDVARVERVVTGGRGLVRIGDEVRFVDGALPGELVEIEWDPKSKRARRLVVLEPAASRREPPCSWARSCGGCDFIHADEATQAAMRVGIVREQLEHAMRTEVDVESVPASRVTGYRTRTRLHLEVRGKRAAVGYFAPRTNVLVPIEACLVLADGLLSSARAVAEACVPTEGERAPRELSAELSVAFGTGGLPVVDMVAAQDPPSSTVTRLVALVGSTLAGVSLRLPGASRPVRLGDPRPIQVGLDERPLVLASGGFGQPSDEGARALAKLVMELAAPTDRAVLELHAGSGTFSVGLAASAKSFSSIEESPEAVDCARENLAARGLRGKLRVGDAESATIPTGLDVVVLDPPRQGARLASPNVARARPRRVVYVSCDPATLARDLQEFRAEGYSIDRAIALDLFPQTSHVETVLALHRARPGRGGAT
jgi:23S rRNA (uracil1939-C5)-methyltransferase